jgi:hypothetical protein
MKEAVSKLAGIDPEKVVLADLYNSRLFAFLSDSKQISTIRPNDVTLAYVTINCHH